MAVTSNETFRRYPTAADARASAGGEASDPGRGAAEKRAWRLLRLCLALVPVPVAFAFQVTFWSVVRPFGLFIFVAAVYISSWIGGFYTGLVSTLAAAVLALYFFVPPERTFAGAEPRHLMVMAMFVALCIVISVFHERFKKANRALGKALAEGQRANVEIGRLYEKTKSLDELKTRLFAGVSHELRTPLTLVLGPTERLIQAPSTNAAVRRDLELVARNAGMLVHYVDDILEVAKLEAGGVEPNYAETDLAHLVRFVASHFEVAARSRGMSYEVQAPEALRGQVDEVMLQRMLLNLLSNAFRFTPDGGRIRVTLRAAEATARAVFEVADSGPGIPADKREAVFQAYLRLEGRGTRTAGGTGLGLSIAQELVALHGGRIRVEDAPEGGALFVVDLPRKAPPGTAVKPMRPEAMAEAPFAARSFVEEIPRPPPAAAALSGPPDGAIVLVVEDNPDMNEAICDALRPDYRVSAAFDGKEGLRRALELRPDLVLTDFMMPEMNGEELVRALRAHPEVAQTPVLVLTALADDETRVRMLREGARDYVTKPFRVEELLARVEGAVAQRRSEREIQALSARLLAVSRASITVAEAVGRLPRESIEAVLRTIASQAQTLTGAQYAAVGLGTDPEKPFDPWIFVGMSAEQAAALGRHPRPVGALGVVARGNESLRLGDVRSHPAHIGFPAGHPQMSSFLGVPIRYGDRVVGHLYLTNKHGDGGFTDEDQSRVEMLAARAGTALETARLYQAEGIERAWLEAVIEQMPDAIVLLDATGRVAALNRAAVSLRCPDDGRRDPFGNPIELRLSSPSGERLPPEELPYVRAFARGEPVTGVDLRIRKPDGSVFPVVASAVAIRNASGEPMGAIAVFRDVSVERELERMRTEWTAVIAHDLRQPVGVIGLATDVLRRAQPGPTNAAEEKLLDRIKNANRRLSEMIDELLDATRLHAGRLTITPADVGVAAVAREVCERMATITQGHPVSVREAGVSRTAWADPGRVEQVIANLLSNACKYGAPGTAVRIDVEGREDDVEVTVTNRGRGIPPEELPTLFQRFMRSKTSQAASAAGIGLGLYICKGLVEAQRGRIWVESTPGETTSFHFTLPARAAPRPSSTVPDSLDPVMRPRTEHPL